MVIARIIIHYSILQHDISPRCQNTDHKMNEYIIFWGRIYIYICVYMKYIIIYHILMHLCVTTFSILGVQLYLKFSACDQQWFSMGYILCSLFTTVSTWIYPRFASRCHKQHSAVSCAKCDFWYSIDTRVSDMHLASHETIVTQITIFMGPTWVLSAQGGPHVGPMYLAIGEFIPLHNVCLGCRSFFPIFSSFGYRCADSGEEFQVEIRW